MKYFCLCALLCGATLDANNVRPGATVESISITGAQNYHLSRELLQNIQSLIGEKYNQQALDSLSDGIRNELGGQAVKQTVAPGGNMDGVKVVLEVSTGSDGNPAGEAALVEAATSNINSRYTVEEIELMGADKHKLSDEVAAELQQLVGQKFNQEALDHLARRIRKELGVHSVSQRVTRGQHPEHVRVVLEVDRRIRDQTDFHLSKYLYHSKQAWSAKAFGDFDIAARTSLVLGVVSDADDLLERYSGVAAGFESRKVFTDRVRLRFLFEDYHQQWNGATLTALEANPKAPGIYRTRRTFQPWLTFVLARPLKASVGAVFNLIQTQFPTARHESANTAAASLRYLQRFDDSQRRRHAIRAGYDLRAATRTLDSDFVYARHQATFGYKIAGPNQAVVTQLTAGTISGRAPLFERYTLGNATTLRGWNKFDVAPLGSTRMVHNSLEYRHSFHDDDDPGGLMVFYDVGAAWDQGAPVETKHSVGIGARWDRFFAALAFPIKAGRMAPQFMIGLLFTEGSRF